jgi:hypothetical protein
MFLFLLFVAWSIWPPTPSVQWVVTGFLVVAFLLASINVASRIFCPSELYFELTNDRLEIRDLKRSGHGYRVLTFKRADVREIHYSSNSDYSPYIETVSGKRTVIVGEIFED